MHDIDDCVTSSLYCCDYICVMDMVFMVISLYMLYYHMYSYYRTSINTLHIVSPLNGYLIQTI